MVTAVTVTATQISKRIQMWIFLTKLFYNTNSPPERWRFAYDKLGVCLRETTTLVLANLLFLCFKLDLFKMLIVNLLHLDGDLFGVFEITLQT